MGLWQPRGGGAGTQRPCIRRTEGCRQGHGLPFRTTYVHLEEIGLGSRLSRSLKGNLVLALALESWTESMALSPEIPRHRTQDMPSLLSGQREVGAWSTLGHACRCRLCCCPPYQGLPGPHELWAVGPGCTRFKPQPQLYTEPWATLPWLLTDETGVRQPTSPSHCGYQDLWPFRNVFCMTTDAPGCTCSLS